MVWYRAALLVVLLAATIIPVRAQSVQSPRHNGVVESVAADRVALSDGRSFALIAESRFNRVQLRDLADLHAGQNVGIVTQPQPDDALAVISVHISNPERVFTPGEVSIIGASENIMNNAVIEEIGGGTITFRLPGGTVTATLPSDTPVVAFIEPGTADDVHSGAWISALVDVNGAGQHIYIEYP